MTWFKTFISSFKTNAKLLKVDFAKVKSYLNSDTK